MNMLGVPDNLLTALSNGVAITIVLWIIILTCSDDRGNYS